MRTCGQAKHLDGLWIEGRSNFSIAWRSGLDNPVGHTSASRSWQHLGVWSAALALLGVDNAKSTDPSEPAEERRREDPRPRPPEKPFPDECCGSGCVPCILDVYEDELDRYRAKLTAWQARNDR